MYQNIIDSRRRDGQKKIGKFIDYLIINNGDKTKDLGVRDIVKIFNIWNITLEQYFGSSYKLVKNKKIYILDNEIIKLFQEIINTVEKTNIKTKEAKTKRLLFAYLYYKLSQK